MSDRVTQPVKHVEYMDCDDDEDMTRPLFKSSMEEVIYYADKQWHGCTILLDLEEAYFHDENLDQFSTKLRASLSSKKEGHKISRKHHTAGRRRKRRIRNGKITKASSTAMCTRSGHIDCKCKKDKTKSRKEKLKSKERRRRKIIRHDEECSFLQEHNDGVDQFLICHDQTNNDDTALIHCYDCYDFSEDEDEYDDDDDILPTKDEILPAKDLGLEEEQDYERLIQILEGDEITPEDYDLLLLLDTNNTKSTLSNDVLKDFPILVIGDNHENVHEDDKDEDENMGVVFVSRPNIGGTKCEICFESWVDMKDGTELRRLPCGHTFCKGCIDHWLKEVSKDCPNLSCYWRK